MVSISSEKPAELVYPESRHGGETRACHTRNRADCKRCTAKEEEGFYKFLPANTADRLWQSLSNPAKRHSFVSN